MKVIFWPIVLLVLFSACDIAIEGKNCHKDLYILNESSDTIIVGQKAINGANGECFLDKAAVLNPGEHYTDHYSKNCVEGIVMNGAEYYVVNPNHFNEQRFYDCDSLFVKNDVLKHFQLSGKDLDYLKANDFTLTYP